MRLCMCLWVLAFCILASDLGALADVSSLISKDLFEQILKHRNDAACQPKGGWATAPDGPYAWGYCFIRERKDRGAHCTSKDWPCRPGKQYYGRGPIQLTHNYNYGQAGRAIRPDLINNPDLVATHTVISFKTAIWFWMTPQANKPSSHNVITGRWTPSDADRSANRVPGYGVITNIINGGLECGHGNDDRVASRIGFYRRYCDIFGVSYGNNLDCYNKRPFA
ncbi:hypothetical protein Patl1_29226 [Pistacia atlantica]|uniref:Uncharacterized protein n=1 Tax=Pistacia atlantica TaxID=434234 RepID=A0ACC1BEY3_9ROSI|nr:hypothetical protein Patl1_29226 [Pistacia atlantica]